MASTSKNSPEHPGGVESGFDWQFKKRANLPQPRGPLPMIAT
jgi:hypothetical protein